MHTTVSLAIDGASPSDLFAEVATLDRYPTWMRLVREAEPTAAAAVDPPAGAAPSTGTSERPAAAWIVELQAQVGPFARSKRLRRCCPNSTG